MKINKIYAVNFRNYSSCNLDFSSMINVFYGQNAQGKTNILEAIFYSSFGMSHRTFTEDDLLKISCKEWQLVLNTKVSAVCMISK